jgi:hypothetical protein
MDFKTYTENGTTKSHKTLHDALEYAEDQDDVEKISFVLPTNEKVMLERGLEGWVLDPTESESVLTDFHIEVLKYCASNTAEKMAPEEYWEIMDALKDKGLLEENLTKSTPDLEWLDITDKGERVLRRHCRR